MGDRMTKEQYIERARECAEILRKISDSNILGDGTRESWACGISSNLLDDLINYTEREEEPQPCKIEIDVAEYCHDCPEFLAEVTRCYADNMLARTIVNCQHWRKCAAIYNVFKRRTEREGQK